MADKNPLFAAKPTDSKDVAWGLTTADTCWKRGERSEALKWLRRAVESASEAEDDERALELAKVAADLATQIGSMAPPPAPSSSPARSSLPPPPTLSRAPARPALALKKEAPKGEPVALAETSTDLTPVPPSKAPRSPEPARADEAPKDEGAREKTPSQPDKAEPQRRPSRAEEMDAWPTEVLSGDALPPTLGLGAPPDESRDGVPTPRGGVRVTQAVRVLLWRATDGSVRVAAQADASTPPAGVVEVTVTALDPEADLVALFSPLP